MISLHFPIEIEAYGDLLKIGDMTNEVEKGWYCNELTTMNMRHIQVLERIHMTHQSTPLN